MFKFKFDAKAGNNIYIDNIRIGDPAILGMDLLTDLAVNVYPNPAKDLLTIDVPEGLIISTATFYDVMGKRISSHEIEKSGTVTLEVNELSSGVYMLQLDTSIGEKIVRVILE